MRLCKAVPLKLQCSKDHSRTLFKCGFWFRRSACSLSHWISKILLQRGECCWFWHHILSGKDVVHQGQGPAYNKCSASIDLLIDCLLLSDYFIHYYKVETRTIRDTVPDLKLTIYSIFNNYLKFRGNTFYMLSASEKQVDLKYRRKE